MHKWAVQQVLCSNENVQQNKTVGLLFNIYYSITLSTLLGIHLSTCRPIFQKGAIWLIQRCIYAYMFKMQVRKLAHLEINLFTPPHIMNNTFENKSLLSNYTRKDSNICFCPVQKIFQCSLQNLFFFWLIHDKKQSLKIPPCVECLLPWPTLVWQKCHLSTFTMCCCSALKFHFGWWSQDNLEAEKKKNTIPKRCLQSIKIFSSVLNPKKSMSK